MENIKPNQIFESYTADYTSTVHKTMRADGQWFQRIQGKGRYGYTWSAWRQISDPTKYENYIGHLVERKARLPK